MTFKITRTDVLWWNNQTGELWPGTLCEFDDLGMKKRYPHGAINFSYPELNGERIFAPPDGWDFWNADLFECLVDQAYEEEMEKMRMTQWQKFQKKV